MPSKQKILIYRLGSLGDTIMVLPCFHLVKNLYPEADIILLTNKPIVSKAAPLEAVLGKSGFFFNEIINYPIGTRNPFLLLSILWKIRSLRIDTIINLSAARSKKSAIRDKVYFRLGGITKFYGFPKSDSDFNVVIDPDTGEYEWEAIRLRRRMENLGEINLFNDLFWDLKLTKEELATADSLLIDINEHSKILTVCAGTKMQSKDWGIDNWCQLLEQLGQKLPDWTLLMIGAEDEYELGKQCLEAWKGKGKNLCGLSSPRVSAAILKKSRLFVGHDSGPMHLAACVGTPLVAVFASINRPRQWFPRGSNNTIVYHPTDCMGCKLTRCIEEKKKCILSITVKEVEAEVLEKLKQLIS